MSHHTHHTHHTPQVTSLSLSAPLPEPYDEEDPAADLAGFLDEQTRAAARWGASAVSALGRPASTENDSSGGSAAAGSSAAGATASGATAGAAAGMIPPAVAAPALGALQRLSLQALVVLHAVRGIVIVLPEVHVSALPAVHVVVPVALRTAICLCFHRMRDMQSNAIAYALPACKSSFYPIIHYIIVTHFVCVTHFSASHSFLSV